MDFQDNTVIAGRMAKARRLPLLQTRDALSVLEVEETVRLLFSTLLQGLS
jgi:hypothetical protein